MQPNINMQTAWLYFVTLGNTVKQIFICVTFAIFKIVDFYCETFGQCISRSGLSSWQILSSACSCFISWQILSSACNCLSSWHILSSARNCFSCRQILSSPCNCFSSWQLLSSARNCFSSWQILTITCNGFFVNTNHFQIEGAYEEKNIWKCISMPMVMDHFTYASSVIFIALFCRTLIYVSLPLVAWKKLVWIHSNCKWKQKCIGYDKHINHIKTTTIKMQISLLKSILLHRWCANFIEDGATSHLNQRCSNLD